MIKIHLSRLLGERRISQAELARHTGHTPEYHKCHLQRASRQAYSVAS